MTIARLTADQITIAVTVYDRTQYVCEAVESALSQTVPVQVMVVEDCAPSQEVQSLVKRSFGERVVYHRNPRRRGLFDNWNACLEYCATPWLSILHDDDLVTPRFVASMLELNRLAPDRGFYYGRVCCLDERGRDLGCGSARFEEAWRPVDLGAMAEGNPVLFPGQLFQAGCARALGGFRSGSQMCGDWEMWFRLSFHYGGAATREQTGAARVHQDPGRGTIRVLRTGKKFGLDFVQAKRNLALLRQRQPEVRLDRARVLRQSPLPTRFLLQNAAGFSRRLLAYNVGLLLLSKPPHARYACFQRLAGCLGPGFVRQVSRVQRWAAG